MEEYRDMDLTAEAFMRTLERPGLEETAAGIVLQAYIPDSFAYQKRLCQWARSRVASGGAPITLRLVKGANMESERCEASQKGWPQAPYMSKLETDANFHRMVCEAMKPENIAAVHVGIASHNLFDLAFALVLAQENGVLDRVQFEMLEGMANPQRRAVCELTQNLLLYAPVCHKENFINAIGYLIRRLDENTGPENFLRYAFRITAGSPEWRRLEEKFLAAAAAAEKVSAAPRRTQNRQLPPAPSAAVAGGWQHLENEPDTDFSLPHNSDWAKHLVAAWAPRQGAAAAEIPLVVAGEEIRDGRTLRECLDPSRPASSWAAIGRPAAATSIAPSPVPWPTRTAGGASMPRPASSGSAAWPRSFAAPGRTSWGRPWPTAEKRCRNPIRKSPKRSISSSSTGPTPAGGSNFLRSARSPRAWSPWSRPGTFPSPSPAAALPRRWRRAIR